MQEQRVGTERPLDAEDKPPLETRSRRNSSHTQPLIAPNGGGPRLLLLLLLMLARDEATEDEVTEGRADPVLENPPVADDRRSTSHPFGISTTSTFAAPGTRPPASFSAAAAAASAAAFCSAKSSNAGLAGPRRDFPFPRRGLASAGSRGRGVSAAAAARAAAAAAVGGASQSRTQERPAAITSAAVGGHLDFPPFSSSPLELSQ